MSTDRRRKKLVDIVPEGADRRRTPDRRKGKRDPGDTGISRRIRFDDKGNAVMDVRVDLPRRREDDDTIDLLEVLDPDSLGLEIED